MRIGKIKILKKYCKPFDGKKQKAYLFITFLLK